MSYIIMTLLGVSVVLFILSFFMHDRLKEMDEQIEHVSMTMMQHNYQTKQKLKILEEELLADDIAGEILKNASQDPYSKKSTQKRTIEEMHERGYKINYIAKQMDLSEADVRALLYDQKAEGVRS
ncbi:hypothetical protein EQV77_01910 [Halobacillus fulvus]|nr:hypothetical protein EQV77_01910 [Halobacillus fulvus]